MSFIAIHRNKGADGNAVRKKPYPTIPLDAPTIEAARRDLPALLIKNRIPPLERDNWLILPLTWDRPARVPAYQFTSEDPSICLRFLEAMELMGG
jgi:hypothetical protein